MMASGSQLFEGVKIVQIEERKDEGVLSVQPSVSYRYPNEFDEEEQLSPEILYPDLSKTRKSEWMEDDTFILVRTDKLGIRTHIYGVRYVQPIEGGGRRYPTVFSIISHHRNAGFFFELALVAVRYAKQSISMLERFLSSIEHQKYPSVVGSSLVLVEKEANGEEFRREIRNRGEFNHLFSATSVINKISPEYTVCIVAALLAEQRVLLVGPTVSTTTKAVAVFASLLRPLDWPHGLVTLIPDQLNADLCHNPTPYLMGMQRNNLAQIREILTESANQIDFAMFDIETGLIIPTPPEYGGKDNVQQYRYHTMVTFCEQMGMAKKLSTSLLKSLKSAITESDRTTSDARVKYTMFVWFASLFGHFRMCNCHLEWNDLSKRRLVALSSSKSAGEYVEFLSKTHIFDSWIMTKIASSKLGPMSNNDEEEVMTLESLWNISKEKPPPLNRMANRMRNVLHLNHKK